MSGVPAQELRIAAHRALVRPWAGPDTVLLHGFTGRAEAWDAVTRRLSGRRGAGAGRLVALDLPGHHSALAVDRRGAFSGAIRRLGAALDALSLGRFRLAGYSMGARLALGLLVADPGRVERAVLVGARPGLASPAERRRRRALERSWSVALRERGTERFMDEWERLPLFATQERLDRRVLRAQAAMRRTHDAWRLAASLDVLGLGVMPDLRPRLAACDARITLVAGADDGRFVECAGEMAAQLPRATVAIVPRRGHNVPLEAPGAVADRIEEGIDDE